MQRIRSSISECIANADFVSAQLGDTVDLAVAGMRAKGTHSALVLDGDKLSGIFTERDYLSRIMAHGRNPSETPLRDVMTPAPETLRTFDCVSYAINRMAVRAIRNLPILDDADRPVSVLDVRLVMMHLVKVFAEIESEAPGVETDAWIDLGGG